jgi:hypothetical protein
MAGTDRLTLRHEDTTLRMKENAGMLEVGWAIAHQV